MKKIFGLLAFSLFVLVACGHRKKATKKKNLDSDLTGTLAISGMDELEGGKEITKESNTQSFFTNWKEHCGNEFKEKESFDNQLRLLFQSFQFIQKPQVFGCDWKEYEAVVENNTGSRIKNFLANVYLIDEIGTELSTDFISAQDWTVNQKAIFTFSTDKEFSKITVVKNFVEVDEYKN